MVRKLVAEFVGTFALVFIGCGAVIADGVTDGKVTPLGISLAFGLTVTVMIYATGQISAAHFNPAVTIGFAVAGRFPWRYVPHYLLAEFAGALFASSLHWALIYGFASNVNFGATVLGDGISFGQGFILEVILTFFLMFVIMAVATDKRVPSAASGLAIGMTVTICALAGGPLTGASMNPARSLAPALFSAMAMKAPLQQIWLYLIAPVVGAAIAARAYEFLRPEEFARKGAPEDLMEQVVV
ncbi:MAG: MIP family channel protein [Armatimonadetes bacterium]|nr:MIP family channel protein [Armatimonadota bacterium]MCX7967392.1 MIP family channel protein [Armatimonadota bacterium]MDW8142625.1 MIP family channel protein [Armatimonadota bacterium]